MRQLAPLRLRLFVIALSLIASSRFLLADSTWKTGTGRCEITPQTPMWMAGYAARDRTADGKLTELWAKAIVLEDGQGNRGLILTLDLVGVDRNFSAGLCEQLARQCGFRREQIAICTSHTHSGPVVGHNLGPLHYELVPELQQKRIDQYAETLTRQIVDMVGRAVEDLEPCELHHGIGHCTFAVNRRNNPEKGAPARRATRALVGPDDHDVPVLAVRTPDGKLKSVLFGYACHATVLSGYQWSGDYPGYAQLEFERLYPDCQAMFWAGCGADQNPIPRRTVELAQHYGRRLANAVEATLMTSAMNRVGESLETRLNEVPLAFDTLPTEADWKADVASGNRYQEARARMMLAQIASGNPIETTYPYPVSVWRLGDDLQWVFLGGEVVVDYALRLKDELEGAVWVAGYANDVMAYIPSRRVLREGGYEGGGSMVYYGLPTHWAPTIENTIVDEVVRQSERKVD